MDIGIMAVILGAIELIMIFPIGYLYTQNKQQGEELKALRADTFSKEETREAIALRITPVTQALGTLHEDIKEVKEMLKEIRDGKAKS